MCGRRCHNFREFKFWVPLYIWIVRKRADQAYKAYRIRYNEELTEARAKLEAHVGKRQSSISVTAVLEADISLLVRSQVSHFDFLEDIVGYHIIKVGSYAGRRICARVLTRLCPIAQAYNSLCGPAREVLSSPQQWQLALTLPCWPRTNAKLGGKGAKNNNASSGSAATSGGKRVRAGKWSKQPDSAPSPWPASRLCGPHCIGRHLPYERNNFCDYPQCHLKNEEEDAIPDTASDAGSECSNASVRGAQTKMYCENCFDPSGTRNLNFCEDCWNRWHGLKPVKQPAA